MSVSAARNVGVFVATTKIVLLIKCTCINKIGLKKVKKVFHYSKTCYKMEYTLVVHNDETESTYLLT